MAAAVKSALPIVLVCGEDDLAVKQRARQLYQQWCTEVGGMDHEIIDAGAATGSEALRALAKLREALQTLPFFGSAKVVWFQNCTFLVEEGPGAPQAVTASLVSLADELKALRWNDLRLLISAGKVDRRRTFYKTLDKIGSVEAYAGLSVEDRDWADQAEACVQQELRALKKTMTEEALGELVAAVGPNLRQLRTETEKVTLFVGDRTSIGLDDVLAVVSRNKQARAFALGDALGDRDLPKLLRCLDAEVWEMRLDSQKTPIGILYGLIAKVRVLLLLKELLRLRLVKPEPDYARFKAQLPGVPTNLLPEDKRYNPLAMNSYVLFKALPQARQYSSEELVRAMDLLLACNQRLVSSGLDKVAVLQQTLVQIVGTSPTKRPSR